MLSGISFKDIVVGNGAVAERGKVVLVHYRGRSSGGANCFDTFEQVRPQRLHLGKRQTIIGVECGIEGMRAGGRRSLEIAPHLAGGFVPPDQYLLVEVELLEVRDDVNLHPEDYPAGKQLLIFRPGEAARNLPRVQFGLWEDGRAGGFIKLPPHPGLTWRYASSEQFEVQFTSEEAKALIESVQATARDGAQDCLAHEDLWADSTEQANSITRDRRTNTPCLTISISERGKALCYFSMREDSPVLLQSHFYQVIFSAVEAHLKQRAEHQLAARPGGFKWSD